MLEELVSSAEVELVELIEATEVAFDKVLVVCELV
jgi:hypothetical protein